MGNQQSHPCPKEAEPPLPAAPAGAPAPQNPQAGPLPPGPGSAANTRPTGAAALPGNSTNPPENPRPPEGLAFHLGLRPGAAEKPVWCSRCSQLALPSRP